MARGEEVMETVNSGWKTGPVSAMEGKSNGSGGLFVRFFFFYLFKV